jgi:flagellar biosynthetic protein FliO
MEMFGQVGAVLAVLALLGGTLWLLRRAGWARLPGAGGLARPARRLQSLDRLPLGPQHSLHLVRVGSEALLVAVFPGGCNTLARYPEESAFPETAGER